MSSISGLSDSSIVRCGGRGRGRGKIIIAPETEASSTSAFVGSVTEDLVDGCALTATNRLSSFADQFSDGVLKKADSILGTSGSLSSKGNEFGGRNEVVAAPTNDKSEDASVTAIDHKIPGTLNKPLPQGQKVPFTVVSVNYEEKRILVKVNENSSPCKAIVRLNNSPSLIQWKKENQLVFENDTLIEKAFLSALELSEGRNLFACLIEKVDGEGDLLALTIELFADNNLRRDFIVSMMFAMVPRLPFNGSNKMGIITNMPETGGTIDIVFYNQVWRGLRQTAHQIQMANKLVTSTCPVIQELFTELIEGFNAITFLAPLENNWSELHRVTLTGKIPNSVRKVTVRYIDIGKELAIPIENLVLPVPSDSTPELFEKTPPQAVTYRVDKLVTTNREHVMRSLAKAFEGRACCVEMIDDSVTPPLVNVFVPNRDGPGTLSLAEVIATCGTLDIPTENNEIKQAPLNLVDKKLETMTEAWEESLDKLKKDSGIVGDKHQECELCIKKLGSTSLTGVARASYLDRLCEAQITI